MYWSGYGEYAPNQSLRILDMTPRITALCAVLASLLCGAAGVWILYSVGLDYRDQALKVGIGLYFLGKAFVVGPMLWSLRQAAPRGGCALDRQP